MSYKKEKKELGIYYAKMLVFIAEEIIAKNVGNEKAGIQKTFSDLQRCGGSVRKNMTYLVTHWIYRLSMFTPWEAVILDPKSERGNWKETLPEIAHEINIVNLTSDKDNAGLLDPFVIMKNVKDAESLAIDILTFLTGISSRDGEKFPVLRKAVRSVTQSDSRGLLHVIDELRREDTPISRNIANHIDSFTDYDFAHLLFSDGTVENAISLDNQLNIIQVADLVLPDKDTTFEEYTTIELLSVSMLIVISTFALDFIHSDRSIFKIVDLDEAWAFLNVAQGETLSNKLVRAGRAMQAALYFLPLTSASL